MSSSARPPPRRWLEGIAALLLVALIVLVATRCDASAWLRPERIGSWLEAAGPLAPLVFIGLMAAAIVVSPIPSLPLDFAAGAAFGPLLGTLYAALGALLGAVLAFLLARLLGRELIERFLGGHIQLCRTCSDHLLFGIVLVSRLIPVVSFDVVSYGAGLTKMSLPAFALATFVGSLPLTYLYVAFGASILDSRWLALALGGVLVALFFLLPRWIERHDLFGLRRFFRHEEEESSPRTP